MGLFSFVKSAGRKIGMFGGAEAAEAEEAAATAATTAETAKTKADANDVFARKLEGAVQLLGIPVTGLAISYAPFKATVHGKARTQADLEKIILVLGNTVGVAEVDDQMEAEITEPPAVFHTVVAGDTLSKISLAQYGVIHLYDAIFEANKPMLGHPDEIFPGQVLRIPQSPGASHTVKSGETLGSIAKHWFGNAAKYTVIFEANRGTLSDPNSVSVGQTLVIPTSAPK